MAIDLILKNCKIWHKNKFIDAELSINKGKIISISKGIEANSAKTIDCKGKIILPGLVDAHVHFREPGLSHKEDWSTGSRAAAKGGITYVIDMPNTVPPTTTFERFLEKKKLAEKSVINFSLYAGIGEENIDLTESLLGNANVFKVYMGQSTGNLKLDNLELLLHAFTNISKFGKVICVHAEDEKMNERFFELYKNRTDPLAHAFSRPVESEVLAINDAIKLAKETKVKLHICHVTSRDGLNLINKAKQSDVDITCETTPHHLFMTEEYLTKIGTLAKVNPPLRTKRDQKALWDGINDGTIDILVSDHAPHTIEEKSKDIWTAPAGVPGVETTLQLMLNAVNKKMIKLEKLIELMHDNPVKRFGLGNYGDIEVGNDANLTIIDLKKEWKIVREELVTKCKWSPYEDWEGKGMAIMTIVNGRLYQK